MLLAAAGSERKSSLDVNFTMWNDICACLTLCMSRLMHTDFIQRNLFDFELSLKYPVPLPVRAPSRTEYDN